MITSDRFPISVIVLTLNEEANIAACLAALQWADEVILVDSFSRDETVTRAQQVRPDVRVFQNQFEDFGQQRNWALDSTSPRHDWILFVDADERVTDSCTAAIQKAVQNSQDRVGFFMCYRNIFLGKWIRRCTMFPSWQLRLLKKGYVRYKREGHGQREILSGGAGYIHEPYDHLDLSKGLPEWIAKHNTYSSQEVVLLKRLRDEPLALGDLFAEPIKRRRCLKRLAARMGAGPALRFLYQYVIRLGFLDGRAGYVYCLLRAAQQAHIVAKLAESEQTAS